MTSLSAPSSLRVSTVALATVPNSSTALIRGLGTTYDSSHMLGSTESTNIITQLIRQRIIYNMCQVVMSIIIIEKVEPDVKFEPKPTYINNDKHDNKE